MPSSSLSVEMTGEEAKLFQSFQNVIRKATEFEGSLNKSGEAAKKLSREERSLAREAKRAFEEARPPLERYNEKKRQLQGLLERGKITQGEYNAAVRRSKQELDQAATSGEKAFGPQALNWARQLAGALGLAGGIAGGVQLIRKSWEDVLEAQRASFNMSVQMAGPQEGAHMMLGLTTQGEREEFDAAVMAMAKKVGAGPSEVYRRATDVLSARGTMTWQEAMPALAASFEAAPGQGDTGRRYAGAALDLRRAGMDPREAMGFVMQAGEMARVTQPKKIAETVPQVAASGQAFGARPEFGAAMWAAITHGATDLEGDVSRTAVTALLEAMDQMEFPGGKPANAEEALARIQADPELQDAIIAKGGYGGRAKAKVAVRSILRGGEHAQAMDATMQAFLASKAQRGDQFRETAAARASAPAQQVAALERRLKGLKERTAVGRDPEEQFAAGVREDAFGDEGIMQQAGVGLRGRAAGRVDQFLSWMFSWDPTAPGELQQVETTMRRQRERVRGEPGEAHMTELVDTIREMRAVVGKQDEVADKQLRAMEAGPAMVAPGEDR